MAKALGCLVSAPFPPETEWHRLESAASPGGGCFERRAALEVAAAGLAVLVQGFSGALVLAGGLISPKHLRSSPPAALRGAHHLANRDKT